MMETMTVMRAPTLLAPMTLALVLSAVIGGPALAADKLPNSITLKTAGIVPEGVEYDTKNKRFLVGSIAQGTVFVVASDGTLTPFIKDADVKSSIGIEVDEARNRLYVAASDGGVFQGQGTGQAKLGVYELSTGKRLALVDLAAVGAKDLKHFANDLAVAADGSVYVTDTMARVIYKVTPKNVASVFVPSAAFGTAEQFALNGIVAHPGGYLLIAESTAGDVYKVPLDKPESISKVALSEPVSGADGLLWGADDRLIAVRNDKSQLVVALKSSDNWATAKVDAKGASSTQQTTGALTDNGVYVVHPFFGDAKAMPIIERVELK